MAVNYVSNDWDDLLHYLYIKLPSSPVSFENKKNDVSTSLASVHDKRMSIKTDFLNHLLGF